MLNNPSFNETLCITRVSLKLKKRPNRYYSKTLDTKLFSFLYMQGAHTSMTEQVTNFGNTVQQMRRFFRGDNDALNSYLSKCIYYSGLGSNDYLNNYFMTDFYSTSTQYTPKAFASALLQDYARQLSVSKLKA